MKTRMAFLGTAGAALVLAGAARLDAQDTEQDQPLTITLRGAPAGTPVSAVIDGKRQLVARVAVNGSASVAKAMIGKGRRTNVLVDNTNGLPQVVLEPEGEKDPVCSDPSQSKGERSCRRIGGLLWGTTSLATIVFVGANATLELPGLAKLAADAWRLRPGALQFGGTIARAYFPLFQQTVGRQPGIASAHADNLTTGFGASVMARPWSAPVALRLEAHYSKRNWAQQYNPTETTGAANAVGTVRDLFFNAQVARLVDLSNLTFRWGAGLTYTDDLIDFQQNGAIGSPVRVRRTHRGFMTHASAAVDFGIRGRLGGTIGMDITTSLKGGGADLNSRALAGFTITR